MHDKNFRQQFPILSKIVNDKSLIYFDNAATTQKPQSVIDAGNDIYLTHNANVHRAAHTLSAKATERYEASRRELQAFLNAKYSQEIIFTSGTTEGINLVADTWGRQNLSHGDEILISYAEHHANIVPWQQVCKNTGATLKLVQLTKSGVIDIDAFNSSLSAKTKIVALHHISNVVGKINPIEELTALAKKVGATVLIDAAQSVSYCELDVQSIDCDFLVFSMHKAYGPTGVGVLYGKKAILDSMPVYKTGGEMIKKVSVIDDTTFNELPFKFEPGTPNIAGVIASSAAIRFLCANKKFIRAQHLIVEYMYRSLIAIKGVEMLFEACPDIGIFAFNVKGHHQQDIAAFFDANGVAVRTGHHCAMPLMAYLNLDGCIRASIAAYNTIEEVDTFIRLLTAYLEKDLDSDVKEVTAYDSKQAIFDLFNKCKGWDQRHRQIMLLSKQLKRLSSDQRTEQNLIAGCESKAWIKVEPVEGNQYEITADSDAKIIRGLLFIVLSAIQGKNASQILAFDFNQYFEHLGLLQHLSPSRGNGLLAIVEKIKSSVAQ